MRVSKWLNHAKADLSQKGITSGAIDSQLILSHCLNQYKGYLLAHDDDELGVHVVSKADELLGRRLAYEPMAYILGHREFFNLDLDTDARALIPRGESEILVETALRWLEGKENGLVVEVGTGSGAIICALAKNAPDHTYVATELDRDALDLAKKNALKYHLDVRFFRGSLCEPLCTMARRISLLVANLPYIPESLLTVLDPTVQYYEPHLALSGGSDGLDLYRQFIPQTLGLLAPGGCLMIEHEFDQSEMIRKLILQVYPNAKIETKPDFSGHDRLTVVSTGG